MPGWLVDYRARAELVARDEPNEARACWAGEITMHTYIVSLSSGLGSAEALRRAADQAMTDRAAGMDAQVVAVFADVRGMVASEHAGEDADNYRFLDDIEAYFNATYPGLVTFMRIVEGRDIWQAMAV